MSDEFVFNGVSSRDFEIEAFFSEVDNGAAEQYEQLTIPGRSGDLLLDQKRRENKPHIYSGIIYKNFSANYKNFKEYLLSQIGYQRLTDTFHPNEFYYAVFDKELEVIVDRERDMGKFKLEFNRKPQRFLLSGEEVTTLTADGTVTNPTLYNSQPLLRVYGAGNLGINGDTITISQADEYTDIDCELMDAFKGLESRNQYVTLTNYSFPVLVPGENGIALGSGITRVEITPRWCTV